MASSRPVPQDSDRSLARAPVTWLTERPRLLPYAAVMHPNDNDFVCPVCDRPMRLATVLNYGPYEQTFVLQCRPCGLSTTKTVEVTGRRDGAQPSALWIWPVITCRDGRATATGSHRSTAGAARRRADGVCTGSPSFVSPATGSIAAATPHARARSCYNTHRKREYGPEYGAGNREPAPRSH
jgi:hypothetical protein